MEATLKSDPWLGGFPYWFWEEKRRYNSSANKFETVGIIVKRPIQERERLLAALLGVAQTHGLSLADPLFGLLWMSPAEEERRANVWMKGRRPLLLDDLQRLGRRQFFALSHTSTESFYVVVDASRYGKPESKRAMQFREELGRFLWPGERLVPFAGRLVVEGPEGAYRFHFNWEGNGKHASWTADFREPECPIIPTRRSSMRMLLRTPSPHSLVEVGMLHPVVAECIPDPADRYTSLYFCNRKLLDRVPREVVEQLKAAKKAESRQQGRP